MLVDPLPVKYLNLGSHTAITAGTGVSFALVDLAPGKTVRKAASTAISGINGPATLTISHSVSKENGVVPTDRLLVRIDVEGFHTENNEGLKAFAYLVVGAPRGAFDNGDNAIDTTALVELLLGVFAVSPTAATLSEVNLARMLAGEP